MCYAPSRDPGIGVSSAPRHLSRFCGADNLAIAGVSADRDGHVGGKIATYDRRLGNGALLWLQLRGHAGLRRQQRKLCDIPQPSLNRLQNL